ncbi:tungsten formylmethanofuran dehydrogenase [Rubricoccus marinus]|uniref:Tungsten formylmethanofuran dehydrogenase n=1 Tax=Rubricoccus marinus TaxID=716817 RepID=A0A259U3Z9_9BACT|nr:tungsten formylmethanofuran dehydrogenase [Rubricoccus marinus]
MEVTPVGPEDFDPDELKAVLRTMMTSRKLDDKMLTLLKQGKGFFHIGSMGHEAAQVALATHLKGGHDWFCMYYRDLGTSLEVGMTPADVLRAHFAKKDDVFGGGRQMPEHFGHRGLNIMTTSSSVGAQFVPAVGFGLAIKRDGDNGAGEKKVVYVSGGDGSTSQGAFHEAMNWAARESLPVLFHVQDNGYAISVPRSEQTASGSIWPILGGYPGMARMRYDGTDFFESYAVAQAAVAHARAGNGPVALHADVVRLLPHSSSDDHKKYRTAESIEADAKRDPIASFSARLIEAGIMTDAEVEALRTEVAKEIDALAKTIEAEPDPDPSEATTHVYYEGEDTREYEASGETGDLVVMVDAINHAMDEEMERDERVLVYGEDVGGGKGGVFTATRGLTAKYGDRCFNSPLAEHSVIGSAVGLAAAGYKPVVEIQFADYIWPAMQQIRNQVASFRYRSRGEWACPMVIRVPAGGYIHGGLCHSQNVEAMFSHFPGLQVVMPSNAADAKGLLKSAIRGEDPVIFLEHKALYRQGPARRPEPGADYLTPLGKAAVAREGSDLTIVTWGALVYKALNVAKALEKEGVNVEVIDVRSFMPFDTETVLASAKKTGRVLVAYEDHEFMGFGAEIAAQISDAAFPYLDAPVKRVAGAFSHIPYADPLEKVVLPQDDDVMEGARAVLAY